MVHISKNCSKLQILIGIMSTFSENYIQIDKVWPQLQPKTWSEAILKKYKSCTILSINSLQKCILEAVIDCLEIQSWLKGEIVPNWMSSLSIAASKMHFSNTGSMFLSNFQRKPLTKQKPPSTLWSRLHHLFVLFHALKSFLKHF